MSVTHKLRRTLWKRDTSWPYEWPISYDPAGVQEPTP